MEGPFLCLNDSIVWIRVGLESELGKGTEVKIVR